METDSRIRQIDAEIAERKTVEIFGMTGNALYLMYGDKVGEAVISTQVSGGCIVEFAEGKGIVPGVYKAFMPRSQFDVSSDTTSKVMVEPHSKFPVKVRLVGVSRRGDSLVIAPAVSDNIEKSWKTFLEVAKRDGHCAYARLESRAFDHDNKAVSLLFNFGRFGHCFLKANVYVQAEQGRFIPYVTNFREYQLRVKNPVEAALPGNLPLFELTGKSRRVAEVEDDLVCVRKPQEKNAELKTQADPIPTMGASALKKHLESLRLVSATKVEDMTKSIAKRNDYPTRETLKGKADWWTSFKSLQAAAELAKEASE